MENVEDDSATLEAFRLDVATFRKTRHENVILYMGACMNPPKLAIVTSLCKGKKLFKSFILDLKKQILKNQAQKCHFIHGCLHESTKTSNCKGKIASFFRIYFL